MSSLTRPREKTGSPPTEAQISQLADIFAALGDPTRLRIVSALANDVLCVCELSEALGITPSNCSHQLRLLRALRLVRSRREGKHVYYTADDEHVRRLVQQGLDHVAEAH
ncbi:MAG: hypothetical protein AMXMBFR61_24290 [Fimbriimonadales bacterium]